MLKNMYADPEDTGNLTDRLWVQFVRDHQDELIASSIPKAISIEHMHKVRYRPMTYLTEENIPVGHLWIFLMINRLLNSNEFVGLSTLLIPNIEYIVELYEKHNTIKGNIDNPDVQKLD